MHANASYKVSGHCYGARDQAAALIFNSDTVGGRVFTIRNFIFREAAPLPVATTLYNIYRTTAQSGGDPVILDPLDTAAAAVPSQVSVATYAAVTTGGYMHGRWLVPTATSNVAQPTPGGFGSGSGFRRTDTGSVFDHRGFTDTQNVVLREGEGIAFANPSTTDNPQPNGWIAHGIVKVGNDTFCFNTTMAPAPNGLTGLGLFNGSGSGVVVEILAISFMNPSNTTITGITTDATVTRICRVYGYESLISSGEAMNITSLGGTPVPSQLQVLRNTAAHPLYVGAYALNPINGVDVTTFGYPGTLAVATFRAIGAFRHSLNYIYNLLTLGGATTGAFTSVFQGNQSVGGPNSFNTDGPNKATQGIRLNAGEGLAFIVDNPTLYSNYYFEVEITHEPPQVSGTSPVGYAS